MQYNEFDINAAHGVRLTSEIRLGRWHFAKGHALTQEDILVFKMFGIKRVYGALMNESDIEASTATGIIAAKLCGENTAFQAGKNAGSRIVALNSGVLMIDEERLAKFNRLHPAIVLNAQAPYSIVSAGQVIAELELRAPLLRQDEVDEVLFKLSGNSALLSVANLKPRRASLIYTKFDEDTPSTAHFTDVVTKLVKGLAGLEIEFGKEYYAEYQVDAVADEIEKSIRSGHEVTFILSALPISAVQDVIPAAIAQIADEIVCKGLPICGAADFLAADKRGHRIIVLPYSYADRAEALIDEVIKQVILTEKLQLSNINRRFSPYLAPTEKLSPEQQAGLIMPKNYGTSGKKANIAAVILAAGQGRRAGRNKLMADIGNDIPLFMKAVDAAIASDAGPVFVITGYNDEEMQPFLDERDVNVIYNPAHLSGVKTTIELGLKAVPSFCDGALLFPADMPNVTAEDINKLISKFKLGEEKQVVTFAHKGVKSNPVIWSKALFVHADIVPENAEIRPVFLEHSDYLKVVELKDKNKLLDVTYYADIPTLKK